MLNQPPKEQPVPAATDIESTMVEKAEMRMMEIENGGRCDQIDLRAAIENYPHDEIKAVIRQMDMRIPPVLMLLYRRRKFPKQ